MVSAISILFFIVSGIQYWVSDYLITVIGIPKKTVFIYFATTAITAPILGAILSGVIGSKLGGYEGKFTFLSAVMAGFAACLIAAPVPFLNNFHLLVACIWLHLFMGGYILPILTGTMLHQVQADQKALANSVANFSYHFFGYMPAPVIYGAVCSLDIGEKSRWGMGVLMYATFGCFFCMIIARVTMKKQSDKSS